MAAVVVYHAGYGCDTGCCGHRIEMGDKAEFTFHHLDGPPYSIFVGAELTDDAREFVRDIVTKAFGAEHVADIDWDNCLVSTD